MPIRLIACSRIHIGLVDLAGVSARSFCGFGFSLAAPSTCWLVENSSTISLDGVSHLDALALEDLDRIVDRLRTRGVGGFAAKLERTPPQHIGLGTKTSLLLSLISAINELKGLNLSTTEIQELSGRGGASGVGINLFFCGGAVWDGGHPVSDTPQFLPSSASGQPGRAPPLLARWPFPDSWLVSLILADHATIAGAKEAAFFQSKTPLPSDQTLQTMSAIYHGVIPGLALRDLMLLKLSLEKVHSVGLKREELLAQSAETVETLRMLQTLPAAATGLSSLGPLLYCISDRADAETQTQIERMSSQIGAEYLGAYSASNSGYSIELI